jgi:hypothetical protein
VGASAFGDAFGDASGDASGDVRSANAGKAPPAFLEPEPPAHMRVRISIARLFASTHIGIYLGGHLCLAT